MARRPGRSHVDWETPLPSANFTWQHVIVEVLMDIREHLQVIRHTLECRNTLRIPGYLAKIASNTTRKKRKKVASG